MKYQGFDVRIDPTLKPNEWKLEATPDIDVVSEIISQGHQTLMNEISEQIELSILKTLNIGQLEILKSRIEEVLKMKMEG